jgi:hypothetical protein
MPYQVKRYVYDLKTNLDFFKDEFSFIGLPPEDGCSHLK